MRGTGSNQQPDKSHEASGSGLGKQPPDATAGRQTTGGHPPPNSSNHLDDDVMRDEPPYAHDDGDRGSGGGDSSDPDGSDSSEDDDPLSPDRGASKKRPRNRGKKGSKRHKYEWNSEKNIPNSLCELPKLETARDYDFLVWKEKSFHSIWGK